MGAGQSLFMVPSYGPKDDSAEQNLEQFTKKNIFFHVKPPISLARYWKCSTGNTFGTSCIMGSEGTIRFHRILLGHRRLNKPGHAVCREIIWDPRSSRHFVLGSGGNRDSAMLLTWDEVGS